LFGGQTYPITTVKPLDGQFVSQKAADGTIFYLAYTSHWYTLSSQAFIYTLYVSLKIYLMIVIITLIISTTNPIQLSFAIEDILNPLKIFKIPVNEWSMTISIALRFVPSLLIESQRILRAQASRGVDFNNGNFKDKIKALVSLVVPMFSIAFYKADDLANAMEARSYNPRYARTRYRNYQITVKD
jgi:energy-coupling factor transport system permease protein